MANSISVLTESTKLHLSEKSETIGTSQPFFKFSTEPKTIIPSTVIYEE